MTTLTARDIRKLNPAERKKRLEDLYNELSGIRIQMITGGNTGNPYRIRSIRKAIARILTVERELQREGSS